MQSSSKKTESKYGYVSLKEYISLIDGFSKKNRWKIPMTIMDKIHLVALRRMSVWSWFSDQLYIDVSGPYGVGFEQLINYINLKIGQIKVFRGTTDMVTHSQIQWRMLLKNNAGVMENLSVGVSVDESEALSKTLGEGLERFCTLRDQSFVNKRHFTAVPAQLQQGKRGVYFPQNYHTYTADQISKHSFLGVKPDTAIAWVTGQNVSTMKPVWIPKQLISAQCQKILVPEEGMIHQTTTNGSAGWFSRTGAITRGIFELLQRDAFLVSWLRKEKLDAVDISTIENTYVQDVCQKINASQATIQILVVKTDVGVPTVIVTVLDTAYAEHQVYVTAHTAATFNEALRGAIDESLHFFRPKKNKPLLADYQPFVTGAIDRSARLALCTQPEMIEAVTSLHSGKFISAATAALKDFTDTTEAGILKQLLQKLEALGEGFTPYVYDYSHPVLKKTGFYVVKCFIPNLFPLYLNEHMATVASLRLDTKHVTAQSTIEKVIQTYPHPFP